MSTVKTTSKDILARCMAAEDITVQHSASADTASFDTLNRVLTLPVWEDMDNALYDMLVGHEVSHALHTPADGWKTAVGDGPLSRMRHMFVNVVEDARIERLIKAQFPGLRRDFASAYTSLHERDLFEVKGKDLSGLALIDRLNLEFKLGLFGLLDVPFSDDEKQYVTRMAETKTFEEVVALAHELFQMEQDQQDDQQEDSTPEAGDENESGEGAEMPSPAGEDGEGDDESASGGAGNESDEDGDQSAAGTGSDSDDSREDSGQSMSDDTDDGESADSTDGDSDQTGSNGDLDYDSYSNDPAAAGSTQNAFENGVSEMRDTDSEEYSYSTLPTANLDRIVVDHTAIAELFDGFDTAGALVSSKKYLNSIKGIVNGMVQQFQMKQAADADKRTSVAKTGILDPVSMINYRWSEDIFLKNETIADGKNHGIVMYLDWSGSMCNILHETMEQLLVLVEFCRKVNIPFEVYAFSSQMHCPFEDYYSDEASKWREGQEPQFTRDCDTDCTAHDFQLYNWLSSRMNKREYATGVQNLWATVEGQSSYSYRTPRCLGLGSTPLNEAVLCAMQQVPEFQNRHGVQIVSTVFLTDGEGHGMIRRGYSSKAHVTDKKTKKSYAITRNGRRGSAETDALLNMLRDRTGSNLVGIRLHDSKNIKHLRWEFEESKFEALAKQYKTENYITLDSAYDELFLVQGDLKVETDALEALDDDASYTRIKNAFIKGGNRKKTSRVISNKMVDIFAA